MPKYRVKGHYRDGKYIRPYRRHYPNYYKQLRMGTKVEMEHTNKKAYARKIAIDHLKEDSQYYTKLKKCKL